MHRTIFNHLPPQPPTTVELIANNDPNAHFDDAEIKAKLEEEVRTKPSEERSEDDLDDSFMQRGASDEWSPLLTSLLNFNSLRSSQLDADLNTTWGEVGRACCTHTRREWGIIALHILGIIVTLYFFLFSLDLMGTSAKVMVSV